MEKPPSIENTLETPFTPTEIYNAIYSGGRNRAPGTDGRGLEFYKATWAIIREDLCPILNTMFIGAAIAPQQNFG